MLVLTRKKNESILIGDNIVVTITRTSTGCAKIAIEAPDHVQILRGELCESIQSTASPSAPNQVALTRKTVRSTQGRTNRLTLSESKCH